MDNDFRSLELRRPFPGWNIVYRELLWNRPLTRNEMLVIRTAGPSQNEIQYGPYVIRHPLKIDGEVYRQPSSFYVSWDANGCFRGVKSYSGISFEHLLILIDYADKYMGLHNFDFWKVLKNNG